MELLNKKAKEIIIERIRANYELIGVKPGACRYNFKCHLNSVHDALTKKQEKIAMTFYIDGDVPIIHFLNYNPKAKGVKFTDNTLGQWAKWNEYYFVKYIDESEFLNIGVVFSNYRKTVSTWLPWYVRLLSDYRG